MIAENVFYELCPTSTDACSITKDDYNAARNSWLCTGCSRPKPGVGALDVHVQRKPGRTPIYLVYGVGLAVARRDFLETLGSEAVAKNLMLGKVLDARGRELPDFATFRGARRPVIRGDSRSPYRRCDLCRRHIYSSMGQAYLVGGAQFEAEIYESNIHDLIVTAAIAERLKQGNWDELAIVRLPIMEHPRDGRPPFRFDEDPK